MRCAMRIPGRSRLASNKEGLRGIFYQRELCFHIAMHPLQSLNASRRSYTQRPRFARVNGASGASGTAYLLVLSARPLPKTPNLLYGPQI